MFLGRDMGHQRDYSESIAEKVDAEVRLLIEQAHDEAWQVLNDNRDILDKLAKELLEKETLDHDPARRRSSRTSRSCPSARSGSRATSARSATARRSRSPAKAPVDAGLVDGGVDSEPTAKPARKRPPRTTPGIAPA